MTEINTVFESPVSLLTFNEPILTIFNTQKYFYVATKDTLSRFEIKNQLKATSQTIQKITLKKKTFTKVSTAFYKEYIIVALIQGQLYVLPESKFINGQFQQTEINNVVDFCGRGEDDNSIRVCSNVKKFMQYTIKDNNGISAQLFSTRDLPKQATQLVSSHNKVLFNKPKGQLQLFDTKEGKFVDLNNEPPKSIDVAIEPQKSSQHYSQFCCIYNHKVTFIGEDPYKDLTSKNNEKIVGFKVFYPYAIMLEKHNIEIFVLPCDNFKFDIPFEENSISNTSLCLLPNHSILFSVDKILYGVQFNTSIPQIRELTNKKFWKEAISLALAFPGDKYSLSTLDDLHLNYGEYLLYNNKPNFHDAFLNFRELKNKPPSCVLRHFTELIPSEIAEEKEWKKEKYPLNASIQFQNSALKEIQDYIESLLEDQSLYNHQDYKKTVQILQTILIRCYVFIQPKKVLEFLKKKPEIYFNSTAEFLKAKNFEQTFLDLCKTYGIHQLATKFLKEKGQIDELVKYIRETPDFEIYAKEHFLSVYQSDPKKAALLFCSEYLQESQVYEILKHIENLKENNIKKYLVMIQFLSYSIYTRGIMKTTLTVKLIKIYIDLLAPSIQKHSDSFTKRYISIENDIEPIKTYRIGLLTILEKCERTDAAAQVNNIDKCYLEEKLVAMRRNGSIQECLHLVSQQYVDFSIALNFCEKVYSENKDSDVFTQLFLILIQTKAHAPDENKKKIINLLNTKTEYLDIICVMKNIYPSIKLYEIKDFLRNVTVKMNNYNREKKIENALIKNTLKTKKQQLKYLKGGRVEITYNSICGKCRKPIRDSAFYVLNDNTMIHTACKKQDVDFDLSIDK